MDNGTPGGIGGTLASEWHWASCTIVHWKTDSARISSALAEELGDPFANVEDLFLATLRADERTTQQGQGLAKRMAFGTEIGIGVRVFTVTTKQHTEVYIASNSGSVTAQTQNHLPLVRDGIQVGQLRGLFRLWTKSPKFSRRLFLWPRVQRQSLELRENLLGRDALIEGRAPALLSILNETTLASGVAGIGAGVANWWFATEPWMLEWLPLWVGLAPAAARLATTSVRRVTNRIEWVVKGKV